MLKLFFYLFLLFAFYSYESFWEFVGIGYHPALEYGIAVSLALSMLAYVFSFSWRLDRQLLLVMVLAFATIIYYLLISSSVSVSRGDLFLYAFVTQASLVLLMALLFCAYAGRDQELGEAVTQKVRLDLLVALLLPLGGYYLNIKVGEAHAIFNQNWLIIGSLSFILFMCMGRALRGVVWEGKSLSISLLLLAIVALWLDALGGAFASLLLGLMTIFGFLGIKTLIGLLLIPTACLVLLVFHSEFSFLSINELLYELLDAELAVDYSSGRFLSWDLALESFRKNYFLLFFGGGVDNATNLAFSMSGVTASGHNYWIETVFRVGLVGVWLSLFPFLWMFHLMLRTEERSYRRLYVLAFSTMISLGFFYDVGGFTHLPGTYFYKLYLCMIFMAAWRVRDRYRPTIRSPDSVTNCRVMAVAERPQAVA